MKHFKLPVQSGIEIPKPPMEQVKDWAKAHQEVLAVGALLLLLLFVGVPYYLKSQRQTEKDASNMLDMAGYYLNSAVDAKNGPFKTEQEKYQQSLETFQRVMNNYSGTPSSRIAQYYVGKCQYMLGQYPQAYASFDVAVGELKGTPLSDAAALGKILCMSVQDKTQEAIALYETFLKERPDSFLVPEAKLGYSGCLVKSGDKAKAIQVLESLAKDSAGTTPGHEAQRLLKGLKGA